MQPQSARGVYVMDGADHDLDFGTSGVEGNILIVYPTDKKGNCTIYEFTQGAFYDTPECRQYACRDGNTGADSMIVVMPHYAAGNRKELVITKIGHGFCPTTKGEKFIPVYKGKRIAQLRHSTQDGARTFDKIPLRFIYADKYYCEKAYTLSPEAYKAMVRGIIKQEGLRH